MGLSADVLRADLDALAARSAAFAQALTAAGYPEPRSRPRGYSTLLRTIIGQQVSFKAADSIWAKMATNLGNLDLPSTLLAHDAEALRACGLSRQKQSYALSLAELVHTRALDLDALPEDDEAAIALLTAVKGIGRWSAEVYLLFAEGRRDIWPAGDLAVQIAVGRIMALEARPSESETRKIGADWQPYRGAAAVFAWHFYQTPAL